MTLRVYIGFDERLSAAWEVAAKSVRKYDCDVIKLQELVLRKAGLVTRTVDHRGGSMYDFTSGAPQSTEFATSRFWVPILAHSGWALFMDSDTVCLDDPHKLYWLRDPEKAVMVVKHREFSDLSVPTKIGPRKMDGQIQTTYHRKLWSSVMLFNCDHPANARLNLITLNHWPGRDLHAFKWLADEEIGELPSEANWLVGLQPKPERPIIAHYTLGTPDMPGYENCEYNELWRAEAAA